MLNGEYASSQTAEDFASGKSGRNLGFESGIRVSPINQ